MTVSPRSSLEILSSPFRSVLRPTARRGRRGKRRAKPRSPGGPGPKSWQRVETWKASSQPATEQHQAVVSSTTDLRKLLSAVMESGFCPNPHAFYSFDLHT